MAFRSRGLPSPGCNKCRSRKIRCDETKPTCERCVKIGFTGCKFRDEFERTWRYETANSTEKATEKRKHLEEKSANRPDTPPKTTDLLNKFDGDVLDRFFFDWVIASPERSDVSHPWMGFLPTMYKTAPTDSLLVSAVTALAHASYGQRFGRAASVTEAVEHCGRALGMLNETVGNPDAAPTNEVLVSILLMSIYETVTDRHIHVKGSWNAHTSGAATVLGLRKPRPDRPKIEPEIAGLIFRQTLHDALLRGRVPPLPLHTRDLFCPSSLTTVYSQLDLNHQVATLCSEWKCVLLDYNVDSIPTNLFRISNAAVALDKKLEKWACSVPDRLVYSIEPLSRDSYPDWLSNLTEGTWVPKVSHSYASRYAEILWRFHWMNRLILYQALLYTANLLNGVNSTQPAPHPITLREIESSIVSLIDRLCESCMAPFAVVLHGELPIADLEDLRSLQGYTLLHPIPSIKLCLDQVAIAGVDFSGRKQWLGKLITFLHTQMGFAKAMAIIEPRRTASLPIQLWGLTD